jgi:hypothetical protein
MKMGHRLEGERQAEEWMSINGSVPGIINMVFVVGEDGDCWYFECTYNVSYRMASPTYLHAPFMENAGPRFHIGLCWLTSDLKKAGYEVKGYDDFIFNK